ncbi:MAG: hypothetical protein K8U03_21340 [Planctomycetia bacterium]|nr:hypothetical protein [Planctomycetia bacterium]
MKVSRFFSFVALVGALVASTPSMVTAAEPSSSRALKPGQYNPANETVEFFAGIKSGEIEVKMIHKDVAQGKVFIKNASGKPLNVKLPETFIGVNAQMGGGGMGGGGGGGGQMSGGGGMGGGGGGAGGAGGGGGNFFNVAAEKVGEVPFVSVCLEHGKPDPRAAMKYEIRPLDSISAKPELRETLKLLGQGSLSQRAAQILAWHYNSNMSMEELAAKRIENLAGPSTPYFEPQELREALQAQAYIVKKLEEAELGTTPVVVPKL